MFKLKNKLVIAIICSFLGTMLFLTPISALADQASLSLSPVTGGPYQIGNNFSVSVWAKTGGNKVDTIRSSINFPANLLEVQSVSLGSTYSAPSGGNTFDNSGGNIYWGGGAYGGTTADAVFATITFKAKGAGTAKVSFASNSLMLSAGQAVPFVTSSGTYTIESAAVPSPTPTPAPAPAPAAPSPQQTTPISLSINNTITNILQEKDKAPIFTGKTDVGQAIINFNIDNGLVTENVYADDDGNWQFSAPEGLAPGRYNIEITATHPQNSSVTSVTSQSFEITITEALEILFDVILDVDKETKKIQIGEELLLHLKLLNFGENIDNNSTVNVKFDYIIEDANRIQVAKFSETRRVKGRESAFDKKITLSKNISKGQYFILAKMTYGERQEASSSDSFEVIKPLSLNNWIAITSLVIILIIISAIYRVWKKKPKRK